MKLEVTITRWFDIEATSRCAAAGRQAREHGPRADDSARRMRPSHRRPLQRPDDVELLRLEHEIEGEADADREHQQAEQQAQMLAAGLLAGARAELRADDAADDEDQRQHRIDLVIGRRMHDDGDRHGDEREDQRGADHDRGRHPHDVDQRRHHQEAAADAHEGRDELDDEADHQTGMIEP